MDPFHQTVVMPSVVSEQDRKSPFVALIEGSGPDFSQEVNSLLRDRLRIVAILLFVSHLAFLLKAILLPSPDPIWEERLLFWTHAATTALVGIVALRLCTGCQIMLRHLRFAEFLIFGSSAAFFLLFEWNHLQTGIRQGFVPSLVPPWLILIFTYALLVPNSWRRALAVILPMALAPAAVLAYGWFAIPEMTAVRERLGHSQYVMLETLMVMATGATVAVWGVRTIRSLRTAAFQARQLGQYRLRRMLGRGGMGEVYLAEHLMLKRPCAIKLIRPGQTSQEDTLARFEREVQSTAKLSHWNTVEIFDYGHTSDGTFYYVMEYLPGLNLDQIVSMHGPLPPERVIFLLRQVCEALTEAHEQGLVHRDIKPANIFAAKRGGRWDVAKLLDFGLVRAERNRGEMNLTQIGMVTGSPLYMSPEQALGEPVDARSDLYSLGCVAYYLLSGRPPFEAQ
ncbi:MAG: serine/threonine protein kinase, partial [Planctomycetaceae bacterium]|nr:serine/threonine protein kinase [Planctomycetaceae bacterium]